MYDYLWLILIYLNFQFLLLWLISELKVAKCVLNLLCLLSYSMAFCLIILKARMTEPGLVDSFLYSLLLTGIPIYQLNQISWQHAAALWQWDIQQQWHD